MCLMRGLHCLSVAVEVTFKFQITITVCWFHRGQEIFRGLLAVNGMNFNAYYF